MRPGKHGNRHEPEIRDRRLRDEPWIVGQSRLPLNVDGVPRWRTVQTGLVAIPTAKGRAAAVKPVARAGISSEQGTQRPEPGPCGRGTRPTQRGPQEAGRSEEHTSALQSLMRITYAVFCMKKKQIITKKAQ